MLQLDGYVRWVRFWLPIRTGREVAGEVRATLESLLSDRAEHLGRPLTEDEVTAELMAFGRPEVVASRYTRARPLVSAGLMPAYVRVMTISVAALMVVQLILALLVPGSDVGQTLTLAGGRIVTGLLWGFASITLVFAVLTRIFGSGEGSALDDAC